MRFTLYSLECLQGRNHGLKDKMQEFEGFKQMDLMKSSVDGNERAHFVTGGQSLKQDETVLNGGQAVQCTKSQSCCNGLWDLEPKPFEEVLAGKPRTKLIGSQRCCPGR